MAIARIKAKVLAWQAPFFRTLARVPLVSSAFDYERL